MAIKVKRLLAVFMLSGCVALSFGAARADASVGFHTPNTGTVLSLPPELQGAQSQFATALSGFARTDTEGATVAGVTVEVTDATGATTALTPTVTCDDLHVDCEWVATIPFPLLPGPYTAEASVTDSAEGSATDSITVIIL